MNEEYINHGAWQIGDLGIVLGACHTPTFDNLMTNYRLAQKAVDEDENRIHRLPRPWLGDPHHRELVHARNIARALALEYLLAHKDLIIIEGR